MVQNSIVSVIEIYLNFVQWFTQTCYWKRILSCLQYNTLRFYLNSFTWAFAFIQMNNICEMMELMGLIYKRVYVSMLSSVQFSRSVVSNSLRPYESQHARPLCPSPTPRVHSDSFRRVSDAIRPSHPRSSPSPPTPNPSQHQSLFQWVNSSHEVAKVLEFQL